MSKRMRDIEFRGFHPDENGSRKVFINEKWISGEWVHGDLIHRRIWSSDIIAIRVFDSGFDNYEEYEVIPETVGQYAGFAVGCKNVFEVFEGDIVKFRSLDYDEFDCISVVKYGEYKQDGSCGEYSARNCLGFYVDLDHIIPYDDYSIYDDDYTVPYYIEITSLLEVYDESEIIGNIYEDPDLLIQ